MALATMITSSASSLSSCSALHPSSSFHHQQLLLLPSHHHFPILPLPPKRHCSALKSSPDNNEPKSASSRFLDEQGVVDDMAGYLNDLSLEYDSVWDTKPSWCQPWTITLTGVLATAASWLVLHSPPVTVVVLFLICAWWYIFLYSYPKAYSEMIAERRRNVKNGMEDTYGL